MVFGLSLLCQKRQVTFLMVKFFNFRAFSEITIIKVRALACELENSTNYCPSEKTLNQVQLDQVKTQKRPFETSIHKFEMDF